MEESHSLEANSHPASQIPSLLCNLKFHYRVHKSPPLVPILSQMHPITTFPPYVPKIHLFIILLQIGLPIGAFLSDFPTKILYAFLISEIRVTYPAHLSLLEVCSTFITISISISPLSL